MDTLSYELLVNGDPAPPELLASMKQIEVETAAGVADALRVSAAIAPKDDLSGWTLVEDNICQRLTPIRLSIITGSGEAQPLADVVVTEVSINFSSQPGQSSLNVVALDASTLLNLEQDPREWRNMSDSDIAEAIFSEYKPKIFRDMGKKLVPIVEPTKRKRHERDRKVVQRDTAMRFLRHLATRNENYVVYFATNPQTGNIEAHFHPKLLRSDVEGEVQGVLRVNMGEETNVDSFSVSYDMMAAAKTQITAPDVDTKEDQPARVENIGAPQLGTKPILNDKQPRKVMPTNTGLPETADVPSRAQAETDRSAQNSIRANGTVTTAAYGGLLRPGYTVAVVGAGEDYSGKYYVERVSHNLSGEGYTQSFSLSRNALG